MSKEQLASVLLRVWFIYETVVGLCRIWLEVCTDELIFVVALANVEKLDILEICVDRLLELTEVVPDSVVNDWWFVLLTKDDVESITDDSNDLLEPNLLVGTELHKVVDFTSVLVDITPVLFFW